MGLSVARENQAILASMILAANSLGRVNMTSRLPSISTSLNSFGPVMGLGFTSSYVAGEIYVGINKREAFAKERERSRLRQVSTHY
jgi:hypothetical protein